MEGDLRVISLGSWDLAVEMFTFLTQDFGLNTEY